MAALKNIDIAGMATLSNTFAAREILRAYIDGYKDEMNYFDWLNMNKKYEVTKDVTFDSFVEDSLQLTGTAVGLSTAGTGGANKTIVFLGTAAVPRVGEIIMFPSGVTGFVWSVTANSTNWDVVVKPIGSGINIPAVADGAALVILSNAQSEGGQNNQDVRRPSMVKRQNNIQIFSSGDTITDIGGATQVEIPWNGSYYMLNKQKMQMLQIHEMQVANQALFGKKDSFTGPDGKTVYFSDGVRTQTVDGGFNTQSAGAGVFDIIVDGKTIGLALDAARAGNEYMALAGQTAHWAIDVNSTSNSAFTGGGISYAAYGGNDKIALAYGVKSIRMGGYTLHFQRFKTLEHKGLTGAVGYEAFKKEVLLIPTDSVAVKGGQTLPRLRMRYMSFNGNKDLRYLDYEGGLLSPNKNTNVREYRYEITSQQAPEVLGIQHFGIFKVQ